MALEFSKGSSINLEKAFSASKFTVGVSWDSPKGIPPYDVDVSCAILKTINDAGSQVNKLVSDSHFVFYNQLESKCGSVTHSGDSLDGSANIEVFGAENDELITVDLSKVPPEATEITFVLTIHEATKKRQKFGDIKGAVARLYNSNSGELLAVTNISDNQECTAVQFVSLYRLPDGTWDFTVLNAGLQCDLGDIVAQWQ